MQAIEPQSHVHREEIKRFQIERLILFTDAVFAIAITLLIIEIKVPHPDHEITNGELWNLMLHQIPEWVGFLISFSVIGVYWNAHHRTFGYVEDYDGRLIFLNFLFLMTIVVMPYTTALYSEHFGKDAAFGVYCFNVAATGGMQILLWRHISNPRRGLSQPLDPVERAYYLTRSVIPPLVFLLAFALSFVNGWVARMIFPVIFLLMFFARKRYERRKRV
jgi:uncharacterized membrane protein